MDQKSAARAFFLKISPEGRLRGRLRTRRGTRRCVHRPSSIVPLRLSISIGARHVVLFGAHWAMGRDRVRISPGSTLSSVVGPRPRPALALLVPSRFTGADHSQDTLLTRLHSWICQARHPVPAQPAVLGRISECSLICPPWACAFHFEQHCGAQCTRRHGGAWTVPRAPSLSALCGTRWPTAQLNSDYSGSVVIYIFFYAFPSEIFFPIRFSSQRLCPGQLMYRTPLDLGGLNAFSVVAMNTFNLWFYGCSAVQHTQISALVRFTCLALRHTLNAVFQYCHRYQTRSSTPTHAATASRSRP
ncbi:hypothetical protein B0H10DRAFT_721851 [Mycena sp. CBHHK59/15]|nr:hypothetical protein B0H10DRAFT_721851 [Mycena sp. CBHHK59/15]